MLLCVTVATRLKTIITLLGLVLLTTPTLAETKFEKLIARAEAGDVASELLLGNLYRWGVEMFGDESPVQKNLAEAVRWLKRAAEQNDTHAKAMLGGIYSSYDYPKRNDAIAAKYYIEVIQSDDPDKEMIRGVQYQLGMLFYQECVGYLIPLNCGPNQTSLVQDYQRAANLFELAAKQGHKVAQFQLATMYENGRGVPQDFAEAASLYKSAADGGIEEAPVMLGELYIRMENLVSAYMWFNIGAADARRQAAERRDKLAKRMTTAQILEGQRMTREYLATRKADAKK